MMKGGKVDATQVDYGFKPENVTEEQDQTASDQMMNLMAIFAKKRVSASQAPMFTGYIRAWEPEEGSPPLRPTKRMGEEGREGEPTLKTIKDL